MTFFTWNIQVFFTNSLYRIEQCAMYGTGVQAQEQGLNKVILVAALKLF